MKVSIPTTAAIVGATLAAGVLCNPAQAQVQLYGTVDVAVGQVEAQPPGPPNAAIVKVRGVHNGGLQTSYFGLKGSEDLGGGLTAKFQLESFMRVDTGSTGRFDASPASGADLFWSREAFVGLAGAFGEVRAGNVGNPVWISMLQSNALGANSLFSPSFRQLFNGGARGRSEVDTAMVNSVRYTSPSFAGLDTNLLIQSRESTGAKFSHSANVGYKAGPLLLTLATQNVRHAAAPNVAGVRDQHLTLLGAAYDFGPVRVFGQYTGITNRRLNTKDKMPHFGFTAPIAGGQLQFSHGIDKTTNKTTGADTAERTTTSLGYVYGMSKRTDLYTFVMNDAAKAFGPPAIAFNDSGKSYVVGIRHKF